MATRMMDEQLFQKTCQPVMNFNLNRLVCKALFVLSMHFILAGHADAASEDDLLGSWTVSVDFSGASQLAQLKIERRHGTLRGTLRSEFGAADIDIMTQKPGTWLLSYSTTLGDVTRIVRIALELENGSLSGTLSSGEGEMTMQWPFQAARMGTDAEATLKSQHAANTGADAAHVAILPVNEAQDFLGAWALTLKSQVAENPRSIGMGLLVADVDGKVVVSLKGLSGPQQTIYDVTKIDNGLRWPYEIRLGDTTVPLHMDITKQADEIAVKLTSGTTENESPFLAGIGVKQESADKIGIDPALAVQKPNVELVSRIGAPARIVQVRASEVLIQEGTDLTVLPINNPLCVRFKWFRVPEKNRIVSVVGSNAYVFAGSFLHVYDISAPTRPRRIGSCELPGNSPDTVVAKGSLIFAANWNGKADTQQLHIIDVSNPLVPTLLNSHDTPMGASNYDLAVSDSKVYLANAYGLRIIDIIAPDAPVLINNFRVRGQWARCGREWLNGLRSHFNVHGCFMAANSRCLQSRLARRTERLRDVRSCARRFHSQFAGVCGRSRGGAIGH